MEVELTNEHLTSASRALKLNDDERRKLSTQFWAKVEVLRDGKGCWLWRGGANPKGYGRLPVHGYYVRAHRLVWLLVHRETPALSVLHKCDVPACVRPDHLFLGTNGDNCRDRAAKSRSAAGERNGSSKLTEESVKSIRREYAKGGITQQTLARQYGVTGFVVSCCVRGTTWRHVVA